MSAASESGEGLASTVQRLGVLLAAGVTPASAWRYLAEAENAPQQVMVIADRIAAGDSIPDAVLASLGQAQVEADASGVRRRLPHRTPRPGPDGRADAVRGLAAAWWVATESGAPLSAVLDSFASSLRDLTQTRRAREIALAAPIATAKLVVALPAVGLLFGFVLGFDTIGTLFATPVGLVCLITGAALMLLARFWNRRLVARAEPADVTPGLALDLLAVAVSGGASLDRSEQAVARAIVGCGLTATTDGAAGILALSHRAGVPAAALLRAEAEECRRESRAAGERAAARLSVTLMIPLGLCVLPAFMLLGVAPLMISVVGQTFGGLT